MAVTVAVAGLVLVEHEFRVPLDHARPDGEQITVFAREVADPDGRDRPFLVYFQGGPGMESPRPTGRPVTPIWLNRALRDYRVLLLDQRGTGRSTPVGDLPGRTPREQADYLTHFRADSIVADAELIRAALDVPAWSVLGQSFGGFCVVTYLSQAPQGLRQAFITGGVPPVGVPVDDIYRATYVRIAEQVERYYQRYPGDRARVRELVAWLDGADVRLPGGDRLTSRRLRQLGNHLGMTGGAEHLHYVLELPRDSRAFRYELDSGPMPFARNPLYAVIHEACYADGMATNWSAARVQPPEYAADPALLTGEHVFPWMFDEFGALHPLREAAQLLAAHPWPRLYDADVLRGTDIPVAAAIYADDPYVESGLSMRTADLIRGMRPWLTNEYDHNALRMDGERVLGRLIDLATGRA